MIGSAIQSDTGADDSLESVRQLGPSGVKNCHMVKPSAAGGGRRAAETFPGVEPEVVVIASGRDEGGAAPVADRELKSKNATIETKRPFKVRNF